MKTFAIFEVRAAAVCLAWGVSLCAFAEWRAPQNQWVLENPYMWDVPSSPQGIAVDERQVYVTAGHKIHVYTLDGQPVASYGSVAGATNGQFNTPAYLDVYKGELYVADQGNARVQVLSTNGVFRRVWSAPSGLSGLAVNDRFVYVGATNQVIQAYTHEGVWQFSFGSSGTLPEQFSQMQDLAADNAHVYVANYGRKNIKVFTSEGAFVRQWDIAVSNLWNNPDAQSRNCGPFGIAVDDQTVCITIGCFYGYGWFSRVQFFDKQSGDFLHELTNFHERETPSSDPGYGVPLSYPRGVACKNPVVYIADNALKKVTKARQIFRTLGTLGVATNRIATGEVVAIGQRAGTPILDVDYVLSDDQPAVTAYVCAFKEGVPSLSTVLPMKSLIEGTAANVGSNMTVGVTNHLSWDVGADWSVDYGNVRVAVLAKDDRNLLDLHYLHLPAVGANPPLTINHVPVTQNDLLNLWFWVLAAGDSRVALTNAQVIGVGGAYDGLLLASNTTTTAGGRAFLFDYVGVREAAAGEVQQAKEGSTPGTVTQWPSRYTLPDGRPAKVNAFGFDTSSTNGWWVVPLN